MWHFADAADMNAHDHTNFGVLDGDICSVASTKSLFSYVEADTAWRGYPAPSVAVATGFTAPGSTNTGILRWDNVSETGDDFTWSQSATLGDWVTVAREGLYTVSLSLEYTVLGSNWAASINVGATPTNTYVGFYLMSSQGGSGTGQNISCRWTGKVDASDKIWIAVKNRNLLAGTGDTNLNRLDIVRWGEY
jgi:hypothetical protein